MSRYAPLPPDNSFDLGDASDDDDDDTHDPRNTSPTLARSPRPSSPTNHPLLASDDDDPDDNTHSHSHSLRPAQPNTSQAEVIFDAGNNMDDNDDPSPAPPGAFDYPPPPGSPPLTSGNSNGVPLPADFHPPELRQSMLRRALGAILPTHYGPGRIRVLGHGGGTRLDGVFANMSAKPDGRTGMRRGLDEGDNPDWVPEIASNHPPPSYTTAQADSVPPYYEAALGTSGHTFTSPLSPSSQLLIDNLPPGSLFSFLWNLLVSLSFQFVGFLLTYLLHTSHAAKQGSRAGLGITLIQYGFYIRQRAESMASGELTWHLPPDPDATPEPRPTFATAAEAHDYFINHNNTLPNSSEGSNVVFPPELSVANEWLSFFLMTIGWFVLLTSVLSFWRVKRWERNVRRQAEERAREEAAAAGESVAAPAEPERRRMALDLGAFIERVGQVRLSRLMNGWRRSSSSIGSGEGESEEAHRLEAVE